MWLDFPDFGLGKINGRPVMGWRGIFHLFWGVIYIDSPKFLSISTVLK